MNIDNLLSHLYTQRDEIEEKIRVLEDCKAKYENIVAPIAVNESNSYSYVRFTGANTMRLGPPKITFETTTQDTQEDEKAVSKSLKKLYPTTLVKNFIYVHGKGSFTVRDIIDFNPEIASENPNLSADISNVLFQMAKAGEVRIMKHKRLLDNPKRKVNVYQVVSKRATIL